MVFMVLGMYIYIWSFFFFLFLHVARHPAVSEGRPTAGAQVPVRVSMVP